MGQQPSSEPFFTTSPGILLPKLTKQALCDEKLGYIYLGTGRIMVGKGLWRMYELNRYAPYIQQYRVQKGLVLDQNQQTRILDQICGIKFENLLEMSLRGNNIESIQILSRIYMPKIQKLFFCGNNITTIRTLKRFSAPNLLYLSFNSNETLETKQFTYLDSLILQQLFIHLKQGSIIQLAYLAKMQSKNFTKICQGLGKYNHNKQKKCFQGLKRKYKGLCMDELRTDPAQCERGLG